MPGDFTWADFLAGFQEAGQAAISTFGVLSAIAVGVFCVAWFVVALAIAAGRPTPKVDIARERGDFDDIDWDFPEITHRTHRRGR